MSKFYCTALLLNFGILAFETFTSPEEILNFVLESEHQSDGVNKLLMLECAVANSYLGIEEYDDSLVPLLMNDRERKMLQMCQFRALADREEYRTLKTQFSSLDQLKELDAVLVMHPLIRRLEYTEITSLVEPITSIDVRLRVYLETFREASGKQVPREFCLKVERDLTQEATESWVSLSLHGYVQQWDEWDKIFRSWSKERIDDDAFSTLAIDAILAGNLDRSLICLEKISLESHEHWTTIQKLGAILVDRNEVEAAQKVLKIELLAGRYFLFTKKLVTHYYSNGMTDHGMEVLRFVSDELSRVSIALEAINDLGCPPQLVNKVLPYAQNLLAKHNRENSTCEVGELLVKVASIQGQLGMKEESTIAFKGAQEIYASHLYEDGLDGAASTNLLTPEIAELGFSIISQFIRLEKNSIASGMTDQLLDQMEKSKLTAYRRTFVVEDAISSYLSSGRLQKAWDLAAGRSQFQSTIVRWYGTHEKLSDGMDMISENASKKLANQLRLELVLAYMRRDGKDYPLPTEWYPLSWFTEGRGELQD